MGSSSEVTGEGDCSYVILSNLSLLDCPICLQFLTIPIYQCCNGHVSCSSCHPKLKDKCPLCAVQLGNIRNRAIEGIIESVEIPCFYKSRGCSEKIVYRDKSSHKAVCIYAPYTCPFADCDFVGFPLELYHHLKENHLTWVLGKDHHLDYNCDFVVEKADKFVVFLQPDYGEIFILSTTHDKLKMRTIIEPAYLDAKYGYHSYTLCFIDEYGAWKYLSGPFHTNPLRKADGVVQKLAASRYLMAPLCSFFGCSQPAIARLKIHTG